MRYENLKLRHMLAAEYALGTLRGRARDRFERLLDEDRGLRPILAYWENRLGQLGLDLTPVTPPDSVWQAIERRVGRVPAAERPVSRPIRPPRPSLWQRTGFWRGWAAMASAACLALAITLWVVPGPGAGNGHMPYVSVMSAQKGQAKWLIMLYPGSRRVRVKTVSSYPMPKHHALELWMLPSGQKKPVALGVIPGSGSGWMPMPSSTLKYMGARAKLAVSLEPAGGSPTGQPTGPVLSVAQVMTSE